MDILNTLRFVQGAASTKDLIPEMKHFVIKDGVIRAFNGMIAISSPIDFEVNCAPKVVPLVQAIRNCDEVTTLGMTDGGRLRVRSGPFRAFIDCVELENMADHQPEGDRVEVDGAALLAAIKVLNPFVGNDASRLWVNGIMFEGQSAFATNNVCLVEYWIGDHLPFKANVPMAAIKEVVRIGQPPEAVQVSEHSITFHYPDGRWIRSQLFSTEWPDIVSKILNAPAAPVALPETLFDGLELVKPFLEKQGIVYFRDGKLHTSVDDSLGASYEVERLPQEGVYKHKMLSLLKGVATSADFSTYPKPCMFYGDRLRGAIVGLMV